MDGRKQERTPPLIEDFLFICDGAYKQNELVSMEMDAFRTIGYDLGIPLSYRFLRRYARVSEPHLSSFLLENFKYFNFYISEYVEFIRIFRGKSFSSVPKSQCLN